MFVEVVAGLLVGACIVTIAFYGLLEGGIWMLNFIERRRQARVARLEAELDRKQDELRRTILSLAEALGANAHEARRALIRESFLATGRVPDSTPKSGS